MALVLAIEPDLRQAAILKRIVKEKVKADIVVVDSRDAALEAIRRAVPDVLLLSALMSPRDEDELIQHLRSLDAADHLQTHTIPQLASTLADHAPSKGGGLLKAFRRKKEPELAPGCDPDFFADEIRTFVQHAAEKKEERRAFIVSGQLAADAAARSGLTTQVEQPAPQPQTSSWDDPFAWNPTGTRPTPAPEPEPQAAAAHDPWSTDYRRTIPVAPVPEVTTPDVQVPTLREPEIEASTPVLATSEPAVAPEPIVIAEPEPESVSVAAIDRQPLVVEDAFSPATPSVSTPEPGMDVEEAFAADAAPMVADEEPDHEVAAAPEPIAAQPRLPVTLGPLATWVRFEVAPPKAGERTTTDELRELMAHLSVPPHVAGVTYARGCRIRRVRVPGGRERRKGAVPGPVILSRRLLDKERQTGA